MHLLTLPSRLEIGPQDVFEPGNYISPDIVAAQLLLMADGGSMTPLTEERRIYFSPDNPGMFAQSIMNGEVMSESHEVKRVLIQRGGGFGDLVLLTPVLRAIKERFPNCHIAVSTMTHYSVVLANLPFVDEILSFPVRQDVADTFDAWVFYENAIEKNPRAKEIHMTDLFAEIAGIADIENKLPEYRIKPSEAIWAQEAYPRQGNTRRVAIQVGCSGVARRYPNWGETTSEFVQRGWEVMLLGTPDELPTMDPKKMNPLIRNLTPLNLTFRQSCAVLNICDAFAGSDTALLHIAGALSVPAVGLYGAFPWKLRTKYCPTTHAIQGIGECSPCFHHVGATMKNHLPDFCPGKKKKQCQVLAEIKPERIVAKVEQIARKPGWEQKVGDVIPFKS